MNRLFLSVVTFLVVLTINQSLAQNGVLKTYHANGMLRSETSYVNDILDGSMLLFHPNGNLYQEKNYSKGILNGWVREFFDNGLLKEEYFVKGGIKDGNYRLFYANGALKELMIFQNGSLVQKNEFAYDSNYAAPIEAFHAGNRQQEMLSKKNKTILCDVDVCPIPIGGFNTIQEKLIYPEHALLYGLEGTVIIIATIDIKGDVIKTNVIKGLGLGCDEAAADVVKSTKFLPGQNQGKIVESNVTINLEFKIYDRSVVQKNKEELASIIETKKKEEKIEKKSSNKFELTCEADYCPVPVGGIESIERKFVIPGIAKRLKLSGNIVLEAQIDQNGIVLDTKIINGIGYGCDDSFSSAIMSTKFIPAKKDGIDTQVTVLIIYPFRYDK